MRVFSKAKFIEAEGQEVYLQCKGWVDEVDGKRVVGGSVDGYTSDSDWEVEKAYDEIAVGYAERYGVIEYEVEGNKMIYHEKHGGSVYCCEVNLDRLTEKRVLINE